jgi:hypothetical protein
MRIRKPVEFLRAPMGQELREVLGPEDDAPTGTYRKVQILTPAQPAMVFTVDHPTPEEAGPNRKYDLPPVPPGVVIPIHLLPNQRLYAAAQVGMGFAMLVVEYMEEEA